MARAQFHGVKNGGIEPQWKSTADSPLPTVGDPPSSQLVDIQKPAHQTMEQFQDSRDKTLDEGPDQSA